MIAYFVLAPPGYAGTRVRIAVHETPPLSFFSKDNTVMGIYPDVIREVARRADWKVEWVRTTWLEGLELARNGKVDLLGPIAYSQERSRSYTFNRQNVIIDWGQVYLPGNSTIQSVLDLEGRRVVFQKGHMVGKTFEALMQRFEVTFQKVRVDNQEQVFEMLDRGEADAGVVNRIFGIINEGRFDIHRSPMVYSPMKLRFAAPKNSPPGLLLTLDTTLSQLKANKASPYHTALDKWLVGKPGDWGSYGALKEILLFTVIAMAIMLTLVLWTLFLRSKIGIQTKELKETNLLLNAVMENTTDVIFIKDLEGRYLMANTATCNAMGKTKNQVLGKTDADLFPSTSAEVISQADRQVVESGNETMFEEILETAYGRTYWLSNKSLYRDSRQQIKGIIGISRNITELKTAQNESLRLQEQLRQSHKMEAIGTLAGGIAHDFNNILGIIIGSCELAVDDIPRGNPGRAYLQEIKTAALRARDVVRQLLSFARKTEQSMEPVDLNTLVRESIQLLRASIPTTVDLRFDIPMGVNTIKADATQIHQVVLNLCTNSAQAMEGHGGALWVSIREVILGPDPTDPHAHREERPFIRLTVQDTGMGIAPEIQDRIFDPYFTTKEKGEGTGIGLSVVHGIVKNHDGRIWILSEPGKGTVVHVAFPVHGQRDPLRKPGALQMPGGTESILLVDDEPAMINMCKAQLERLGYQVTGFSDPVMALAHLKQDSGRFDLLITDMTMPRMTGAELAREVSKSCPGLPILLCTGFNDSQERTRGMAVDCCLRKPFDRPVLARTVREVLDRSKLPPDVISQTDSRPIV